MGHNTYVVFTKNPVSLNEKGLGTVTSLVAALALVNQYAARRPDTVNDFFASHEQTGDLYAYTQMPQCPAVWELDTPK